MTLLSLLSLLLPPLLGFLLLCVLLADHWSTHLVLKASMASGLGLGVSSCLFFVALLAGSPWLVAPLEITAALLLGCILIASESQLRAPGRAMPPAASAQGARLLTILLCIVLLAAAGSFTFLSLHFPHGGDMTNSDSWANWNRRARYMAGLGGAWRTVFLHPGRSLHYLQHLDYPLLLPLSVARAWTYGGDEDVLVPIAIAALFTFSTVGALGAAIQALQSHRQGLLAALTLLSVPWFIECGSWQYADVPIACFILITLAAICLYDHGSEANTGWLVVAGLAAGMAAWTKDEGLVFVVILLVVRGALLVRGHRWPECRRQFVYVGAGLLPLLAVLIVFKLEFAGTSTMLAGQGFHATSARLTNPGRYVEIVTVTVRALLRQPFLFCVPLIVSGAYALVVGVKPLTRRHDGIVTARLALLLMLATDYFVYVITPYDLGWQLRTSVLRVLLQVVPAGLLLLFLLVRDPATDRAEQTGSVASGIPS